MKVREGAENIYKYNIDLFKEMYYHEFAQRESINNRITVPLGILTLLIGAASYYINNIYNLIVNKWFYIFISVLGIYALLILICIYFLYKAYYGYTYKYIPTATKIDNYTQYFIDYYEKYYSSYYSKVTNNTKNELIEHAVNKMLYQKYRDAIDINAKLNEKKLIQLRKLGIVLIFTIIVGALCIIPLNFCLKKDPITFVKIINSEINESKQEVIKLSKDKDNEILNVPPMPNPPEIELRSITETFTKNKETKENDSND